MATTWSVSNWVDVGVPDFPGELPEFVYIDALPLRRGLR